MLRPIIAEFVTFSVSEIRRLVPSSAAGFLSWPFGRWRRFYGSGFVAQVSAGISSPTSSRHLSCVSSR